MKFSNWFIPALALAVPAFTQTVDLSGLPQCAQGPATTGIVSSGCSLMDLKCICTSQPFLQSIANKVQQVCSPADVATTHAIAQKLCSSLDLSISITNPAKTSTGSVSGASGGAAATTSSSSAAATTTSASSASAQSTGAAERIGAGGLIGAVVAGAALMGL